MRSSRRLLLIATLTAAAIAVAAATGLWIWLTRRIEPPLERDWAAVTSVLAGDGRRGTRDGAAAAARFSEPFGVAVASDGTVFLTDAGDAQAVRRISTDGVVATIARGFNAPSAIAVGRDGLLYVADTGNNAIRRVERDGSVTTLPGDFNGPVGVAVDREGRVIVADTYNDRVRVIERDGSVRDATAERFDTPCGVAVDAAGNIYVAETGAGAVRVIAPEGPVSYVAPLPFDGLFRPIGIAVTAQGIVYVTDERGRIVELRPGFNARTLAGSIGGFRNGVGGHARFRAPTGVAVAGEGRLVVAEPRNAIVRLVTARSRVELRAPMPPDVNPDFDRERFARAPLLWPIAPLVEPYEITGTLGEPRGGGGERFHAGIDVHAEQGTPVSAVRTGVATDPISISGFGSINESVRIGPITYVHLKAGRLEQDELVDPQRFVATYDDTGRLVGMRLKRGARFETGETIGSVNAFYHIHLNVGWPGEELNPLLFRLVGFEDTVPPTIARGGIRLFRETGEPLVQRKRGRVLADGRIRIVVDAWDQVDGNAARRRLGVYRLGYQVLHANGSPASGFESARETIVFDRLAADPDAARVVYESGSGIPYYRRGGTRFLYVVTNTLRGGVAAEGTWDAGALPPGDYTLRVLAADLNGNEAVANRDLAITIPQSQVTGDGTTRPSNR